MAPPDAVWAAALAAGPGVGRVGVRLLFRPRFREFEPEAWRPFVATLDAVWAAALAPGPAVVRVAVVALA